MMVSVPVLVFLLVSGALRSVEPARLREFVVAVVFVGSASRLARFRVARGRLFVVVVLASIAPVLIFDLCRVGEFRARDSDLTERWRERIRLAYKLPSDANASECWRNQSPRRAIPKEEVVSM